MKIIKVARFVFNNDTKEELNNSRLVLLKGEIAIEMDTQLMKVGDGKTQYRDLPYFNRGPRGADGEKGESAAAIYIVGAVGSVEELPADANVGDSYMVVDNLWAMTINGWTNIGPVKGEKGDTGLQGKQGEAATIDISVTGTWIINGTDTGKLARGPIGNTGVMGPQGFDGVQEPKGDPFTYDDFTQEQLASLKGPKGDTFTYDDLTTAQKNTILNNLAALFGVATYTKDGLMSKEDKSKVAAFEVSGIKIYSSSATIPTLSDGVVALIYEV